MKRSGSPGSAPTLGIAITTMNRADVLKRLLDALSRYTVNDHVIVVCDDGSTDHTMEIVAEAGAVCIHGERRGVAWNKNRGIYYLLNNTVVSHLLLLDDDVIPSIYAWDEEWVRAIDRFGHINYAHIDFDEHVIGPRILSATCPGVSKMLSGVCLGFSRQVISQIGYMDNRFGLYGYEHADLTERAVRAGYGGFVAECHFFLVIRGGIQILRVASNSSEEAINLSAKHFSNTERIAPYVLPWHDPEQYRTFHAELNVTPKLHMSFQSEDILQYVATNPDIEQSLLGGVRHWLQHGQHEGRVWKP